MNQTFDTNLWLVQSILIMFGLLFAIPMLRALVGIGFIVLSVMLPRRRDGLRNRGVSFLPVILRVGLGITSATLMMPTANAAPHSLSIRVVQPGESLWSIAAETLSQGHAEPVTAQAIDNEWRRLWRENYVEIGVDPTTLKPGIALRVQNSSIEEVDDAIKS